MSDAERSDFKPGDVCSYTGLHDLGPTVTVVAWGPKLRKPGDRGNHTYHANLVPVFSENYPATRYWWACPHHLEKINMNSKVILNNPPSTATVAAAATAFMSRHAVIHYATAACGPAVLVRLHQGKGNHRKRDRCYGFVYMNRTNFRPVFVAESAAESIYLALKGVTIRAGGQREKRALFVGDTWEDLNLGNHIKVIADLKTHLNCQAQEIETLKGQLAGEESYRKMLAARLSRIRVISDRLTSHQTDARVSADSLGYKLRKLCLGFDVYGNAPDPLAEIEETQLDNALQACRALSDAYEKGAETEHTDWNDVDVAHKLAKKALQES